MVDKRQECREACSFKSENSIKLPGLKKSGISVFSTGVEMSFDPFNLYIDTTHTWNKEMENTKDTTVEITLGDEDPGDEIVVDLYYDRSYGTIVFETIAGRTKCPQELGTLPQEDPGIQITKYPSQVVFPNEEMIFELELSNLGVGDESLFNLYAQLLDDEGGTTIKVDGAPLTNSRGFPNVKKGVATKKTLSIATGPRMYINKPISLTFESACMDDGSL